MTLEFVSNAVNFLQDRTTLMLIIGAISIMSISVAVSSRKSVVTRTLFLMLLSLITLQLYRELNDVNGEYFLNVGTEILGTLLTLIVLSEFVLQQTWLFPGVFLFIILSTLPIEGASENLQPFLLNLSTELMGAFILVILLQRRDWLWNSTKRKRKTRLSRAQRIQQKRLSLLKQQETNAIMEEVQAQFDTWRSTQDTWDIGLVLAGRSNEELKNKLQQLKSVIKIISVKKVQDTEGVVRYTVIASSLGQNSSKIEPPRPS